jgi:hypothetical protein
MPRPRQRVCLDQGLKLNLNTFMRQGCVMPGAISAFRIVWTNNYSGEETARASITTNMMSEHEGRLHIHMDDTEQTIYLVPRARRFGGHQWYFACPVTNCCCSVLWRPAGATHFRSRRGMGEPGCLCLTIPRSRQSCPSRQSQNQTPIDWRL